MGSETSTNPQVVRWFQEGAGANALLGRAPYVLLDRHWGRHDTLLVLRTLRTWVGEDRGRAARANSWIDRAWRDALAGGQPDEALVLFNDTHIALDPAGRVRPASLEAFAGAFDDAASDVADGTMRAAINAQLPYVCARLGVLVEEVAPRFDRLMATESARVGTTAAPDPPEAASIDTSAWHAVLTADTEATGTVDRWAASVRSGSRPDLVRQGAVSPARQGAVDTAALVWRASTPDVADLLATEDTLYRPLLADLLAAASTDRVVRTLLVRASHLLGHLPHTLYPDPCPGCADGRLRDQSWLAPTAVSGDVTLIDCPWCLRRWAILDHPERKAWLLEPGEVDRAFPDTPPATYPASLRWHLTGTPATLFDPGH